jgi:hypothetical protein
MSEILETVSREQLYDMVWTTPMKRFMATYGLDGSVVARHCKMLDIPLPPPGHWTGRPGHECQRPPLPKLDMVDVIRLPRLAEADIGAVRGKTPKLDLTTDLAAAHRVVLALHKSLRRARKDDYGRLHVGGEGCSTLAVTHDTSERALLLLDTFIKAVANRGYDVRLRNVTGEDACGRKLVAIKDAHEVELGVHEVLERRPHKLTRQEKDNAREPGSKKPPPFDHFASGRLQVVLVSINGTRRTVSDTGTQSLDDCLGLAVVRIDAIADHERRLRVQSAQWDCERQEREQRRTDERDRVAYREHLETDLKDKINRWRQAEELRAFLAAVEAAVPGPQRDETFTKWVRWASDKARTLDPVSAGRGIALPLTRGAADLCGEPRATSV